ncbi:MAG: hypothetical protein ACOCX1_00580 [Fimbriimonadaceae bacterium]
MGITAWPDADEYVYNLQVDAQGLYKGRPVPVEQIEGFTQEQLEEAVEEAGGLYLEIAEDSYRMRYTSAEFAGPWRVEDETLVLEVETIDGQSMEQLSQATGIPLEELQLDPFRATLDERRAGTLLLEIPESEDLVIEFETIEGTYEAVAPVPPPAPMLAP